MTLAPRFFAVTARVRLSAIMDANMSKLIRTKPVNELRVKPGSVDLVNSESMKPYMDILMSVMAGKDSKRALAALPLEQRYVWRVISALKRGLCDLETENVATDIATLSEEDLMSVSEALA